MGRRPAVDELNLQVMLWVNLSIPGVYTSDPLYSGTRRRGTALRHSAAAVLVAARVVFVRLHVDTVTAAAWRTGRMSDVISFYGT